MRIKDMDVGTKLACSRHGGLVSLTEGMKKDQRRVCDDCIARYKQNFGAVRREQKREQRREQGAWLDRASLHEEVWMAIPRYPAYQASSHGRIRSVDRLDSLGRKAFGRVLSAFTNRKGYASVNIYAPEYKRAKTVSVHSLVAEAFIGPRPIGFEVAHNDGNPSNNTPLNLRYATHQQNEADKAMHGTKFIACGEKNGHAKLSKELVGRIREAVAAGITQRALAEAYGVTSSAISNVVRGVTWRSP